MVSHSGRDHKNLPRRSISPLCCKTSQTHATCSGVKLKVGSIFCCWDAVQRRVRFILSLLCIVYLSELKTVLALYSCLESNCTRLKRKCHPLSIRLIFILWRDNVIIKLRLELEPCSMIGQCLPSRWFIFFQ